MKTQIQEFLLAVLAVIALRHGAAAPLTFTYQGTLTDQAGAARQWHAGSALSDLRRQKAVRRVERNP